jgi:Skp family chaperone for outer membrane proteins
LKRILVLCVFGLAVLGSVSAQQFAKTGVINLTRVNQVYKAGVAKHFDDLKVAIQKDLDRMKDEIRLLNDQRNDASSKNDSTKVASLDLDIKAKRDAFAEFGKRKQEELATAGEAMKSDTTLQKLLPQDVEQSAISKGFALIVNSANPAVIWYGPDADITDDVINRLAAETQLPLVAKPAGN